MITKAIKFWREYEYEIIIVGTILFILLAGLVRCIKGKKGSWDYFDKNILNTPAHYKKAKKKRGPPKESKGEIECKRVLEKIFNKPFNKIRPNFLNNPVTGGDHNLEIDCYNSELKIGCEYNGQQHYKYIPFFHKNKEAFQNQQYRDELKRRMCKEEGILLIEVPYTVRVEDIESYIKKELKSA